MSTNKVFVDYKNFPLYTFSRKKIVDSPPPLHSPILGSSLVFITHTTTDNVTREVEGRYNKKEVSERRHKPTFGIVIVKVQRGKGEGVLNSSVTSYTSCHSPTGYLVPQSRCHYCRPLSPVHITDLRDSSGSNGSDKIVWIRWIE